jgi:hypothetical protein
LTPSESPSLGPGGTAGILTPAQLRIRLIDRLGRLWYCDPDFWPVAREDEQALAVQRWPEIANEPETLAAIGSHLGIPLSPTPTDAHKLAIYREWKVLRAIALEPVGGDRLAFDYLAMPAAGATTGTRWRGTIGRSGSIQVTSSEQAPEPVCPICLALGQPIDTPLGPIAVEALRPADAVWSLDGSGRRVAERVLAVGSASVPAGHEVVRLVLADGRSIVASAGHPLADGRRLGALRPGDAVNGAVVVSTLRERYAGAMTFDLLIGGPTGVYAIDGVWLASTLAGRAR